MKPAGHPPLVAKVTQLVKTVTSAKGARWTTISTPGRKLQALLDYKAMQGVGSLVELCRSKGLRVTPQRLAVFRVLAESDGHLSVEEVWEYVRASLPTVALKTVYEALHELEAVGEIRLARFGTESWRVELRPANHHGHLVCDRCGAVCDVEADYPNLVVPLSQRRHFVVGRAEVVFAGLCDSCAEGRNPAVDR